MSPRPALASFLFSLLVNVYKSSALLVALISICTDTKMREPIQINKELKTKISLRTVSCDTTHDGF